MDVHTPDHGVRHCGQRLKFADTARLEHGADVALFVTTGGTFTRPRSA
ncbi:hypothetical protein N7U49_45540 [Streptomyces sp. AD2-2]|nr:hypothetical protein N7U49_45540 [Streptomyces sp. AD2-2]